MSVRMPKSDGVGKIRLCDVMLCSRHNHRHSLQQKKTPQNKTKQKTTKDEITRR